MLRILILRVILVLTDWSCLCTRLRRYFTRISCTYRWRISISDFNDFMFILLYIHLPEDCSVVRRVEEKEGNDIHCLYILHTII